jgi:beta-galactosidase
MASGKPLAGAVVRMMGKNVVDTTDADGKFLFAFALSEALTGGLPELAHVQPRYVPGRGIVFGNRQKGPVRAELFSLSGKRLALLAGSVFERGIRSIPLVEGAKGLYLCRIKTTDGETVFRFLMNENPGGRALPAPSGSRGRMLFSGSPNTTERIRHAHPEGATREASLPLKRVSISPAMRGLEGTQPQRFSPDGFTGFSKSAAPAAHVDSIITSKPGYVADTLLWREKTGDSVTIMLRDTGSIVPSVSIRRIVSFDKDWLFNKGDASGAEKPAFADASWRALDVPHDWSIEGPFDEKAATTGYGGYLPAGVGWYRKHFTLPVDFSGRRVFIEFDGVMANSTVYVNGTSLGTRPCGYISFRYDITSQAAGSGENVVAVKADNSSQPASRWYTGAGIYGHVRLVAVNPVHIDKWATVVTTPAISADQATVHVQTTVVNQGTAAQNVSVQAAIVDPSGKKLTPVASAAQSVAAGGSANFAIDVPVVGPKLWSPETPVLYQAAVTVMSGTSTLDDEVTSFGIRTVKFDPETGLFLNGKSVKLKGVCLHHDLSGLGAEVRVRAMQRRLATLKKLGVNAIRTSHNPVAPQTLDLFDRMGFLVLDEFFDVWKSHKYSMPGDYATYFSQWYKTDAADIVKRDRNHPSVLFYSIGNEIRDGLSVRKPITTDLVKICHDNDPTRPVTQALFRPSEAGDYPDGTLNILDVFGVNYRTSELLEAITGSTPHHAGVTTEIAANPGEWTSFVMAHPQVVGEFLWTGADYLGEADGAWPRVGAACGLIDRVGTIKDMGYKYQAVWGSGTLARPQTSTKAAAKVLLTVDHPTITTDLDDIAYVKASIVDASGVTVSGASSAVTFSVTGSAGKIIALDSGTPNGEPFRGESRKAYQGVCFAIVQMTAAGSITVSAKAEGLEGSSVTVTGVSGAFVPCSGGCD